MQIGEKVKRLAAPSDYTNGRTGEIIDSKHEQFYPRYRVFWTHDAKGEPLSKPVRTWVRRIDLEIVK